MATNFTLTLDTTAPGGVSIDLASYSTAQAITATIATSDSPTTGYQMKVWGDVDTSYDANVQGSEGASAWISYAASKAIKLSTGDGTKTVYLKVRDDVGNESGAVSDTTTLDTAAPVPNVLTGPSPAKISKVASFDSSSFTFSSDTAIQAWKVKVVANSADAHNTGAQIPTTAGSTDVTGGSLAASTSQGVTIKGADLETASSGDGSKIVKVFVQDLAGNWSV